MKHEPTIVTRPDLPIIDWGESNQDYVPDDLREKLQPYLERYSWLIPTWCHDFSIRYVRHDDKDNSLMRMDDSYEYRAATLFVWADWFNQSEDQREQLMIHEMVHLLNAPLIRSLDRLKNLIKEKTPDAWDVAKQLVKDGNEASTVDMTRAIHEVMNRAPRVFPGKTK